MRPEIDEKLRAAGLMATPDGDGYWLKGQTYSHRHGIKQAGCVWHGEFKAWFAQDGAMLDKLADGLDGQRGLAEEAAGGFARQGSKHYHGHRERLRNRFLEQGGTALADYELLELLLFFSVRIRDTKPIAKKLIERFGGLGAVFAAEPERYAEIIGDCVDGEKDRDLQFTQVLFKAVRALHERTLQEGFLDREIVSSWDALINYLKITMAHDPAEHFRILFLDRKNILIKDEVQSRGTVDHTPLYPREVVKRALELAASAIIMVHNHPSGDPTPSRADVDMTRQVVTALQAVNITVHDHVIVGKDRYTSFKCEQLI